tara:strand:- start:8829 stop:10892 length:2064 start_codon:yes stop_codon:yes gene_type:complete
MKHIVCLGFALEGADYDHEFEFECERFRVSHYSMNFDISITEEMIKRFDGRCDVIAITGLPSTYQVKDGELTHPQVLRLRNMARVTPVVDGVMLKRIYLPWAMRKFFLDNPSWFQDKTFGLYSGVLDSAFLAALTDLGISPCMADPYIIGKLPFVIRGKATLDKFMQTLWPVLKRLKLKGGSLPSLSLTSTPSRLSEFFNSDVIVSNESLLMLFDHEHLKGKTLIVDYLSKRLESKLAAAKVKEVISCTPQILEESEFNFAVLEALFQAMEPEAEPLDDNKILIWIDRLKLEPRLRKVESEQQATDDEVNKYAFIIHPLHAGQLFMHPAARPFRPFQKKLGPIVERVGAYAPVMFWGTIDGVKSEKTGKEVKGLIYTLTETPAMLMKKDPEDVYRRLVRLCHAAKNSGAKIIGLGAYTKIVGDAGVTVNRRSPIPVTTGNSLSACATLWAAKLAVVKLGMVEIKDDFYHGVTMIVGATGSIGAVSAKVLCHNWKEIVLVAPRAHKLLELKEEINIIAPKCKVTIATSPELHSRRCHLIITTTSARGQKILEIENVRPGAVICDVSRPLDISEEDALKRPDIMVIESGEVELPGDYKMKVDIGLQGKIVYACLAETALLAMDNRNESFTLSRNISYQKVLDIDRMAREHGVRLSHITGHSGVITDHEFDLCKKHALERLKTWKQKGDE